MIDRSKYKVIRLYYDETHKLDFNCRLVRLFTTSSKLPRYGILPRNYKGSNLDDSKTIWSAITNKFYINRKINYPNISQYLDKN